MPCIETVYVKLMLRDLIREIKFVTVTLQVKKKFPVVLLYYI